MDIDLTPTEYANPELLRRAVARKAGLNPDSITHVQVLRRSLDSRRGSIRYHAQVEVFCGEEYLPTDYSGHYHDCHGCPSIVIVGAGPAGIFAALRALQVGLRPILIERGQPVEQRRLDIAQIARQRQVDPESNWCFGEGGAGTFSDGKLYTRSTKRGDITYVLHRFIEHGADPDILIDAHAHIGTDRLGGIMANMRRTILGHGGEYHFGTRVVDLVVERQGAELHCVGVRDAEGNEYRGEAVLLATGHSARDIYELFHRNNWLLEAKPFALGIRVEHPQSLINEIQYHHSPDIPLLPPAAYSLSTQVGGHGVFSFCMCPGGIIVPAATGPDQQVVNGMSNALRNSPYANSGIAVTIGLADVPQYAQHGPLALLRFQQEVESAIYRAAGNCVSAPIQRLTDFCMGQESRSNNKSNYIGNTVSAPLHRLLPTVVVQCLQKGLRQFDRRMHGFYTSQASVLAVESRTSSPVRIPRDDTRQHPQLRGLYPCGEGAGYAGGIVSSALDGINAIDKVKTSLDPNSFQ